MRSVKQKTMTKIILKEKHNKSGYDCILDDKLAPLITSTHASKISHGSDLENLVHEYSQVVQFEKSVNKSGKPLTTTSYPDFVKQFDKLALTTPTAVCKLKFKNVKGIRNTDADFVYVDFINKIIYVCEMKSGADFDTKKAKGETAQLNETKRFLESKHPDFAVKPKIVLWYVNSVDDANFKCKEGKKYLITGREFATMIACPYDEVNSILRKDKQDNTRMFLEYIADQFGPNLKIIMEKHEKQKFKAVI